MYMLIMVLDDTAHLNDVLTAWDSAGVGGVTIIESTGLNRVLRRHNADMAFVGEVGLSGELRAVSQLEARLKEAVKLGFKRCVIPKTAQRRLTEPPQGLTLIGCRTLAEAIDVALIKG